MHTHSFGISVVVFPDHESRKNSAQFVHEVSEVYIVFVLGLLSRVVCNTVMPSKNMGASSFSD